MGGAVWITLLSKIKVLACFDLVPLAEKKGGKVAQLIQQPKPNLATSEYGQEFLFYFLFLAVGTFPV